MSRKTTRAPGPISDDDAELLERLGRIAGTVDPVPDDVVQAAKEMFGLRDPMAVLMETVDQDEALAAVRGKVGPQMHFFEYGTVAVDLEVSTHEGFASVLGVVTTPPSSGDGSGVVSLQTSGASFDTAVGSDGRFSFVRIPAGMLRLRIELPGEPRMTTRWVDAGA
ncbi:carboxypeptidase regulatory-like domain-containing protein [Lapillicoccus sp.]|uniref:carboxypeptidase regulatory-like domain-containing protein n=1 Tax=Lapillicoccus sp. TaxID=1909287 RepID=UPI003266F965